MRRKSKFSPFRARRPRIHKCEDCGRLIRWAPRFCIDCYLPDFDSPALHDPNAWARSRSGRKAARSTVRRAGALPAATFEKPYTADQEAI